MFLLEGPIKELSTEEIATPRGIQTHDLFIMKRPLYRCATISALNWKTRALKQLCFFAGSRSHEQNRPLDAFFAFVCRSQFWSEEKSDA